MTTPTSASVDTPTMARVRLLVTPIAADLGLDIYDLEHRGGTVRLTLDTPVGSEGGVTLDQLALATRLVSKELDAHDPIPSRYTLEVTSPGVERSLRIPAHFQREVGKIVAIRLSDVEAADRRVRGTIVSADDHGVTLRVDDGADGALRTVVYDQIDRARTVFEWGPQPKPGGPKRSGRPSTKKAGTADGADTEEPSPSATTPAGPTPTCPTPSKEPS
jgi:ribosome maturation factor RimP